MATSRIERIVLLNSTEDGYTKLLRRVYPDAVIQSYPLDRYSDLVIYDYPRTLVVFTDGEQVRPELYEARRYSETVRFNVVRDNLELKIASDAYEYGSKLVGIGRGCTLLWILLGGDLYQYVNNHGHPHEVIDALTGEKAVVYSAHNYAPRVVNQHNKRVLVWDGGEVTSRVFYDYTTTRMECERPKPNEPLRMVEAWTSRNVLGLMWHPEHSETSVAGRDLFYKHLHYMTEEIT